MVGNERQQKGYKNSINFAILINSVFIWPDKQKLPLCAAVSFNPRYCATAPAAVRKPDFHAARSILPFPLPPLIPIAACSFASGKKRNESQRPREKTGIFHLPFVLPVSVLSQETHIVKKVANGIEIICSIREHDWERSIQYENRTIINSARKSSNQVTRRYNPRRGSRSKYLKEPNAKKSAGRKAKENLVSPCFYRQWNFGITWKFRRP